MSHIHRASLLCVGLIACGPSAPVHEHTTPLSVQEHRERAQDHTGQADGSSDKIKAERSTQSGTQCIDHGIPLTSGGETIQAMRPCWTAPGSNEAYRREAEFHRKAALQHRDWATKLLRAEKSACAGLAQSDREQSPFLHQEDILSMVAYHESDVLKGARVTFRKVPGLSAEWMSKSVKCHQARAAVVGFDEGFLSYCPLVVRSATVAVIEREDTIVVTIRTDDPVMAAVIYGRSGLQSE